MLSTQSLMPDMLTSSYALSAVDDVYGVLDSVIVHHFYSGNALMDEYIFINPQITELNLSALDMSISDPGGEIDLVLKYDRLAVRVGVPAMSGFTNPLFRAPINKWPNGIPAYTKDNQTSNVNGFNYGNMVNPRSMAIPKAIKSQQTSFGEEIRSKIVDLTKNGYTYQQPTQTSETISRLAADPSNLNKSPADLWSANVGLANKDKSVSIPGSVQDIYNNSGTSYNTNSLPSVLIPNVINKNAADTNYYATQASKLTPMQRNTINQQAHLMSSVGNVSETELQKKYEKDMIDKVFGPPAASSLAEYTPTPVTQKEIIITQRHIDTINAYEKALNEINQMYKPTRGGTGYYGQRQIDKKNALARIPGAADYRALAANTDITKIQIGQKVVIPNPVNVTPSVD